MPDNLDIRVNVEGVAAGADGLGKVDNALKAMARSEATAAENLNLLRKYLNFAEGVRSSADLANKLKEFPPLMSKISSIANSLKDRDIKGLSIGFSSLSAEQRKTISTLQGYSGELKTSTGLTSSFKTGIFQAIPGLGMLATGIGAAVFAITKLIEGFNFVTKTVTDFVKGTIKASSEEEKHRASIIAMVGDVERGSAAYETFDKRLAKSNLPEATYNVNEYSTAVIKGLGKAQLDASEAFANTSMSAQGFIGILTLLEQNQTPAKKSLKEYTGVLNQAGLSISDITSKTANHKEQAEKLKSALEVLAQRQRDAAGGTISGAIEGIKNQWKEYREELGKILNEALLPIIQSFGQFVKKVIEGRVITDLFNELKDLLTENKDTIDEITTKVFPALVDIIKVAFSAAISLVDTMGDINRAIKNAFGVSLIDGFVNGLKAAKTVIEGIVWLAEKYWEIQTLGAHKARSWAEITAGGPGETTPGGGYNFGALYKDYEKASEKDKALMRASVESKLGRKLTDKEIASYLKTGKALAYGGEEEDTGEGEGTGKETKPEKQITKGHPTTAAQVKSEYELALEEQKRYETSAAGLMATSMEGEKESLAPKGTAAKARAQAFAEMFGGGAGNAFVETVKGNKKAWDEWAESTALSLVSKIINALAVSGLAQVLLTIGTAGGSQGIKGGGGFLQNFLKGLGLSFDVGGAVPGPLGTPHLAVVHGGEGVMTTGGMNNLMKAINSGAILTAAQNTAMFKSAGQGLGKNAVAPVVVNVDARAGDLVHAYRSTSVTKGNTFNRMISGVSK